MTDKNPVEQIAEESPQAADLVFQIVTASMDANNRTMDMLYEGERQRRQALEVHIEQVLERLEAAYMGSAREYEAAVRPLRLGYLQRVEELAAQHQENHYR